MKSRLFQYGITTVLAGLVSFFLIKGRYPGAGAAAAEKYHVLCDAFTVPGVILLMLGALLWVSGKGAFTGISWAAKNAILLLIPGQGLNRESYPEYRARKLAGEKAGGYGFFFPVGAVFFLIGMVFLVLYYKNV